MITEQMSNVQMIGFITATVYDVAKKNKANYRIHGKMSRGLLIVEIFNFKSKQTLVVNLLDEDLPKHISIVTSKIQSIEL